MAQRRMFSKSITNSSQFLMMPQSTQCLYFHFGMNADDDGFCEHFALMRMTDSKPDDLKILQAKGFVHVFDDRVLVILAWKENNYLRADRYTQSKYAMIYKEELKLLSENHGIPCGIPDDDSRLPQGRLGKDRIGKERKGEKEELHHINEFFTVSKDAHLKYLQAFPKLDVDIQYKRMISWLESNPKKRKSDYPRFINSWLNRAEKDRSEKAEKQEDLTELERICLS